MSLKNREELGKILITQRFMWMASKNFVFYMQERKPWGFLSIVWPASIRKKALGLVTSLPLSVPMFLHLQNQKDKMSCRSLQQKNSAILENSAGRMGVDL